MGVALSRLLLVCLRSFVDTLYLMVVVPDSAAPSSSSLFLYKAVVSSTRHWYTNFPPLRFVFGGSL